MKKKLIIGLGNPGKKYELTRHNVGFQLIDRFASSLESHSSFVVSKKHHCQISEINLVEQTPPEKIFLAKPQTFINRSGQAVKTLRDYYKIPLKNILVLHDDYDLPLGKIRFSRNASAGGHNGIKSIIQSLHSKNFIRLRVGIKSNNLPLAKTPLDTFVLAKFSQKEKKALEQMLTLSVQAIDFFISHDFETTANKFN